MDSQWLGPLIGAAIVAVIAWVIWAAWKRQKALEQAAAGMGMRYAKRDEDLPKSGVNRLPMYSKGDDMRCENVLEGDVGGATCYLFDYTYVRRKRNGKRSSYAQGTYCCFRLDHKLPVLQVKPAGRRIEGEKIAFPDYPAFQQSYDVAGTDETAVRASLGGDLLDYLAHHKDDSWVVEAEGEWVGIAKRPAVSMKRHVKPEEMPEFRAEVLQIFERLAKP
jgi:hypothetical protein